MLLQKAAGTACTGSVPGRFICPMGRTVRAVKEACCPEVELLDYVALLQLGHICLCGRLRCSANEALLSSGCTVSADGQHHRQVLATRGQQKLLACATGRLFSLLHSCSFAVNSSYPQT